MQVVRLAPAAADAIAAEALRAFPEEGCGFLVGPRASHRIDRALPRPNVHPGERTRRFVIDGLEYVRLEDELEDSPEALLGIFHSHPRHPPEPSATDLAEAWPGLLYLIQAVPEPGRLGELLAWRPRADGSAFEAVPLMVGQAPEPPPGTPPRCGSGGQAPTR